MSLYDTRVVLGWWLSLGALGAPAMGQFPSIVDVEELDGRNGFTVYGTVLGEFGQEIAGVGDVDADGIDDLMTGGDGVIWTDLCWCEPTPGACHVMLGNTAIGRSGTRTADELHGQGGFYIPGIEVPDNAGHVAWAGDFNGDGVVDMLQGAPYASPAGILFAGECYLIYGGSGVGASGFLDLTMLDGHNGFVIQGIHPLGGSGYQATGIGDFNADGVDDIAVGSIEADPGGRIDAGQVYVIFGGGDTGQSGVFALSEVVPPAGVTFNGIHAQDFTDFCEHIGDFNGDGIQDLLIYSWNARPQPGARGQAYVVYGGSQMTSLGEMELADLDGSNGFIINGPVGADLMNPRRLEPGVGVGDLNYDRYMDLGFIVEQTPRPEGFVVFGGPSVAPDGLLTLPEVNGDNGFRFLASTGVSVLAPAGDFNHDEIDDVFVAGPGIQVVYGRPGLGAAGTIDASQLDWRYKVRFTSSSFVFGLRVFAPAGDVNSDGLADFAIGSEWEYDYFTNTDIGALHVIFGRRMGDSDLDADVDLEDYAAFVACRTPPTPGDVPDPCHPFDFDKDLDVDLLDYAAFQRTLATPP